MPPNVRAGPAAGWDYVGDMGLAASRHNAGRAFKELCARGMGWMNQHWAVQERCATSPEQPHICVNQYRLVTNSSTASGLHNSFSFLPLKVTVGRGQFPVRFPSVCWLRVDVPSAVLMLQGGRKQRESCLFCFYFMSQTILPRLGQSK